NNYDIISGDKSKNITAIVCKTLVNNQQLIENLKLQIQVLMKKFADQQGRTLNGSSSVLSSKDSIDLQDFIRSFDEFSLTKSSVVVNSNLNNISDADGKKHYYQLQPIIVQCMDSDRKMSLRNFLENRHSIPIRVCRPMQLGHGSSYTNQKSRFASVLEKIKERRMMLDEKQQKNNETTEYKEDKPIIQTHPMPSQKQTQPTSINIKSDVIYPATTNQT
ncbi:hypothetical protein BLA29_011155, partial [Euroglyphus maynei]